VRVFIFYRLVDAIVVNNGTFSWGTTDDDIEVLKKYVNLYFHVVLNAGWWRGSVVERRSLAGELSLSCARPAADG